MEICFCKKCKFWKDQKNESFIFCKNGNFEKNENEKNENEQFEK